MLRTTLLVAATVTMGMLAPSVTASASTPATTNPKTSLQPSQAFDEYCRTSRTADTSRCDTAAIADIDKGRKLEGLRDITIPSSFYKLTDAEQLVSVANRERAARHLPAMGGNSKLNASARAGADGGEDPTGPSGYAWRSNYAHGYLTPLAADFAWMYDDGPGGANAGCTAAGQAGCWGHRDDILVPWSGEQGAGSATVDGEVRLTQLFVEHY